MVDFVRQFDKFNVELLKVSGDACQNHRGQGRRNESHFLGTHQLPKREHENGENPDLRRMMMGRAILRNQSAPNRFRNRKQVCQTVGPWGIVHHDVKLAGKDQHADAGQHSLHDSRRDGTEPLPQPQRSGQELKCSGDDDDEAQRLESVFCHEFVNEDAQTGRGPADLQWRSGKHADHDAADYAAD